MTKNTCTHHWILGDPSGGIIGAGCLNCGAERTFKAYVDGTYNLRTAPYGALKVDREPAEFAMADER